MNVYNRKSVEYYSRLLLVEADDLVLQAAGVEVGQVKLVVLLLQKLDVAFDFLPLLVAELPLHLTEGLLLRLLGHLPLELFLIYAILEHINLVLVVILNSLHHRPSLGYFLMFLLLQLLLLFQQFVLFELGGQLEYFLAEPGLLRIALYDLGALLGDHSLLKLLLFHLLDPLFSDCYLFSATKVLLPLGLLQLQVHPVLPEQILKLFLLLENSLVRFKALSSRRSECLASSCRSLWRCTRALKTTTARLSARQVTVPLSRLRNGLRQDVANVLIGLHSVVQGHASDGFSHRCRPAALLET